jgi:serine/threonine protein kinase
MPTPTHSGAAPAFGPPATPGELGTLGPYRLLRAIGRGGMGVVYEALDPRLDRPLALKVMLPEYAADRAARERFLREARAAARVVHDNVVTVYEADERNGVPYIAMQLLHGCSLDRFLKTRGSPTLPQILQIAIETAQGLAAAHKLKLVHRDIKPANLWLEKPRGRVKVLDFGLAKPVGDAELTHTGPGDVAHSGAFGTPAYMSPEQARGDKVDGRSDLFSFGAVLYRLVTGRQPFAGSTVYAVLCALATDEPPPVRDLNPQAPEPLAALIHRLLAKKPEDRPQTADEVAVRLLEIARGPAPSSAAPPATLPPPEENAFAGLDMDDPDATQFDAPAATRTARTARPPARNSRGVWLAVGGALALATAVVIVAVVATTGSQKPRPTPVEPPVTAGPVPGPSAPPPAKAIPAPAVPPVNAEADPDRAAAVRFLALGGEVQVNDVERAITTPDGLPPGQFNLTGVRLINRPGVPDADLQLLARCKRLRHLSFNGTKLTDQSLAPFDGRTDLVTLDLSSSGISDVGLGYFKGCRNLETLHLIGTGVTDAGLKPFDGITGLHGLGLGGKQITNTGLNCFRDCKQLWELVLHGTAATDDGLKVFRECHRLHSVRLRGEGIADKGVTVFLDCPELVELFIAGTQAGDKTLEAMAKRPKLGHIDVRETKVTKDGVAAFRAKRPNCQVDAD